MSSSSAKSSDGKKEWGKISTIIGSALVVGLAVYVISLAVMASKTSKQQTYTANSSASNTSVLCGIPNTAAVWTSWRIAPSSAKPEDRPYIRIQPCAKVHFYQTAGKDFVYDCRDIDTEKWSDFRNTKGACFKEFDLIRAANVEDRPRNIKWRQVPR